MLPARLGPRRRQPQYQVDPLDFRHPLVQAFRGRGRAALLSTPVLRYFRLQLPKQTAAQVALALPSGDPLIVTEDIHRGRVVLVATSAGDTAWTPLPLWPSFLPLVQEILAYCVSGQQQQQNVLVGRPLGAPLPAGATQVALLRQETRSGPEAGPRAHGARRGRHRLDLRRHVPERPVYGRLCRRGGARPAAGERRLGRAPPRGRASRNSSP